MRLYLNLSKMSYRDGVVRSNNRPPVCRDHACCCCKNQALYAVDQIQTRLVGYYNEADNLTQNTLSFISSDYYLLFQLNHKDNLLLLFCCSGYMLAKDPQPASPCSEDEQVSTPIQEVLGKCEV